MALSAGPAFADVEPNNYLYQAEGPISATVTGSIATSNDEDWYLLYAASQTQLQVKATRTGALKCSLRVELKDADGAWVKSLSVTGSSVESTTTYTTPVGTNRFFLEARSTSSSCTGQTYRLDLAPAGAMVSGPSMPVAQPLNPEPNESSAQASGPLSGDITYKPSIDTSNDEDWFWFYADAAFSLEFTGVSETGARAYLYEADGPDTGDFVDSAYINRDRVSTISVTPSGFTRYYLRIYNAGVGTAVHVRLSPASALKQTPPPAQTPPPPPVAATPPAVPAKLKLKAKKRKIVARWSAAPEATSYRATIRPKPKTGKSAIVTSRKKAKFTRLERAKKYRVCVKARNAAGASPKICRKIRTKR